MNIRVEAGYGDRKLSTDKYTLAVEGQYQMQNDHASETTESTKVAFNQYRSPSESINNKEESEMTHRVIYWGVCLIYRTITLRNQQSPQKLPSTNTVLHPKPYMKKRKLKCTTMSFLLSIQYSSSSFMPLLLNPYQNLTPNRALVSSPPPLLTSAPMKGPTQNSLIRSTWIAISPNSNHPFDNKRLNRRESTRYYFRKPSGHSCELNCFFTTNTCRWNKWTFAFALHHDFSPLSGFHLPLETKQIHCTLPHIITMSWLRLLLLLVLYFGMFSNGLSRPAVVNIGSIFTFGSLNGKVAKIAMQAAVEDVNSDPSFLGGSKLHLSFHDSNYSGFLGIIGALKYMETDTVAIIGPQNAVTAHVISHLANELQVPLLSFTALDPTLAALQYPFFVQTAPNDLFQMTAITDMVGYYGWRDVIAVFTDDDNGRNGIAALGDKLAERRCKISYKAALPPDNQATQTDIEDVLIKLLSLESRVIVLHSYEYSGLMVFDVAHSLGMMSNGYVWIATSWLSSTLDSIAPLPPATSEKIQGVLTLRPHTPDSEKKKAFFSRWSKLSGGSVGLNPYGLFAYDTVWIIAHAIKTFFEQGRAISFSNDSRLTNVVLKGDLHLNEMSVFDGGWRLLDNILHTSMTGLTGLIQFNPDRSLIHPAYDVINVIGSGFQQIGYWSNYSGLSVVPPETLYMKPPNRSSSSQELYTAHWPGQTTTKPRGWVFPGNGRQLRIGVPNRVSYKQYVSLINGSDTAQGYCIDIFTAALSLLPYGVPYKFIPFGDGIKNPNYNELVNLITTDVFDAVVGDITIFSNRTKVVDFTEPYIESGLVVVVPLGKLNSNAWAFLSPFTPMMWAVTAAFFIFVGAVIWILEHRLNDDFRGPPKRQIATILWFSFSTLFYSHREKIVSTLGRLVLILWLFVVLIINSSYTASLTSILTVQRLSSPIRGIDSLITSSEPIGFQVGSFAENYLNEELCIPKSRLIALGSPEAYATALETGTVSAIVDETPYIDVFLSRYCKFSVVGREFTKSGWGFAFPRDSLLAIDLSTAILQLSENGDLQRIHDKWLTGKSCSSQADIQSDRLQLSSFSGLFIICGIACFVGLFIYFISLIREFSRQFSEESLPSGSGSSRSSSLHRFLSFIDEKKEEPESKSIRKQMEKSSNVNGDQDEQRNGSKITEIDSNITACSSV